LSNPIFEDRDSLIKIWSVERRSRDFMASLMWENVKTFSTLISALITADIFFLRFLLEDMGSSFQQHLVSVKFLSLILPTLIMAMSILGERELRREYVRLLESIVHLAKIENLLGLEQKLPDIDGRVFPGDKYLFQRWVTDRMKFKTSEDFIKSRLKGYNMYTCMRIIYIITFLVGLFLTSPFFLSY